MSYSNAVLALAPLAYWRLSELSGTNAVDEMGLHDGTYVGSPTLGAAGAIAGDSDTAVTFNGTTQWVGGIGWTPLNDIFTFAAWVNRTPAATYDGIIGSGTGSGYIRIDATTNTFTLLSANTAAICTSSVSVTAGWHFVVATKNGATVKLYIDGTDVTGAVTDSACTGGANLNLARELSSGTELFHGSLDEVSVWNRALSAAEVAALYANPPRAILLESGIALAQGNGLDIRL